MYKPSTQLIVPYFPTYLAIYNNLFLYIIGYQGESKY
jgi:hypothetical protein